MSTKITTAYNALVVRLTALFDSNAGWTRIPDPYIVEANPDNFLRQGWGLKVGPGAHGNQMTSNYQMLRTMVVVICREVMKTELDADGSASVDLQLLEDLRSVVADFETNTALSNAQIPVQFSSDSGILGVQSEKVFRAIEAQFTVNIFEQLS